MSKAIAKRSKGGLTISTTELLIGLALLGLVLVLVLRKRNTAPALPAGRYNNAETWNVSYNNDGLPTKIEIHREATRT